MLKFKPLTLVAPTLRIKMTQFLFGSYHGELGKLGLFGKKTVILIKLGDDATCIKMTIYQYSQQSV